MFMPKLFRAHPLNNQGAVYVIGLCFPFRALGTPNNEVWPEVESLQDYKNTFPKWKPGSLASHVKNLDENGLDLLSVSELFFRAPSWCPACSCDRWG